jgi:hypothetical protein
LLEWRGRCCAVYDVTKPSAPVFLQLLKCGDAPKEFCLFLQKNSPAKSLLVVSSENDGVIKSVYTEDIIS